MMNKILWQDIQDFDLDQPVAEYGFSTRLAYENAWTIRFTEQAIIEYKKFMYLAATANQMVSPSEIVDIVWHQHLIFTQSYQQFCKVLGKTIAHIPSTHNRTEKEKFQQAKQRTKNLYEQEFGKQPVECWDYHKAHDSLGFDTAFLSFGLLKVAAITATCVLFIFSYTFLRPVFLSIDNPYFLIGYLSVVAAAGLFFHFFNQFYLKNVLLKRIDTNFILQNLTLSELIYMKRYRLEDVIHGQVNQLIVEKNILVLKDYKLGVVSEKRKPSSFQLTIIESLKNLKKVHYPTLLTQLVSKRVFGQVSASVLAIQSKFEQSTSFIKLMALNYFVFSILLVAGLTRCAIGASRDKPILFIGILVFLFLLGAISFFNKLSTRFTNVTIPEWYEKEIIPQQPKNSNRKEQNYWESDYFLAGNSFLDASFILVVGYIDKNTKDGSYGSTCGSSCGGGSCGGGGGCGGGCGGCGG